MSAFNDELVRDFPDQFAQIRSACECGPGWAGIIRNVCQNLAGKGVVWTCIKEKFGGLRMYTGNVPEEVYGQVSELICQASDLSYITCEFCGKPGTNRKIRGWLRTSCDECRKPDEVEDAS